MMFSRSRQLFISSPGTLAMDYCGSGLTRVMTPHLVALVTGLGQDSDFHLLIFSNNCIVHIAF